MAHRAAVPLISASHRPPRRFAASTREKLLEAAGQIFAERGYYNVTIREICRRAGANVAAVNYTFGDKLGLYTEVLRQSVRSSQTAVLAAALDATDTPEELLRKVIRARLLSICGGAQPDWHFRIVMHEFSQPTPAMARVIDEGMRPIYDRVRKAVGKIIGLPANHEKTRLCNNSIMGQVLFYTFSRPVLARLQPDLKLTPDQLERIADHITEFSLAYLKKAGARKSL
ncbi:MAG TPA: CerR family C-terminal domain-containing protein [Candidatus Acidoferrum sp.]|nr:CerR family C-terminal domain-containing protein [Candidatus Acidoferrum sp.]